MVIFLEIIILSIMLHGCGELDISIKDVKIELGESVSTNILDYISVEGREQDKVVSDAELDTSKIDPMAVGEYQAVIKYEGREIAVPVIVEDTTPPTIQAADTTFVEGDQVRVDSYGNKTVKEIWPNVIKDDGNLPRGRRFISFFCFPYFEDNFVNEDVYTDIKEAYSDMEWSSEFERGNVGLYASYK